MLSESVSRGAVKRLRVLHLASFAGNIGDLANHAGARALFKQHLQFDLDITELEIREFYWKQRAFDDDFVRWANSFDLLIVGGGNYFELWVERSSTGTSFDLSPERMSLLTVPTVFYSLGVDTGQGYTEQSAGRFRNFIETVLEREDMFVCVRNDGSSRALKEVAGALVADRIPVMPDGGFFLSDAMAERIPSGAASRSLVAINIAGDMLDRRFDQGLSYSEFLKEMALFCGQLLDARPDVDIELVPHIWRDVSVIAELLPLIPDHYLRRRMSVARLEASVDGLPEFATRYQRCALVLGMRFHANVCPFGLGVPTRGLFSYPQVPLLYDELGLPERVNDVRQAGFAELLLRQALADLQSPDAIRTKCLARTGELRGIGASVLGGMNAWLNTRHG